MFCFVGFLFWLLFLNCLQLKIICMSKGHIWGGICDALQGTTGERMPEGESGGVGGSGRLSCLLLIHFLFCAVTHTPCPSFHCFQYPQNLVSYNSFLGVGSQPRNKGLHHTV